SLSREAKVAYAEIQKALIQLKRSAAEIHRSLRKAEQRIEADARARIRDLRKEARTQLAVVQSKRQEAARSLKACPPPPATPGRTSRSPPTRSSPTPGPPRAPWSNDFAAP